jgi:cold shock CspA family protein
VREQAHLAAAGPHPRAEREPGVVQWFCADKGYGFVEAIADGVQLLVHHTEILGRSPGAGEVVEFERRPDTNGKLQAMAVTGVGGSDVQGARPTMNGRLFAA